MKICDHAHDCGATGRTCPAAEPHECDHDPMFWCEEVQAEVTCVEVEAEEQEAKG